MNLIQQFKAARQAATPLIAIQTADPAATITAIRASLNGTAPPMLLWDCVRGIKALNEAGKEVLSGVPTPENIIGAVDALLVASGFPKSTMMFMANMHRVINDPGVSQAIWNLRDPFKGSQRTLVLLCPSIELPIEIQQDITVLDEPLPTPEQLGEVLKDVLRSAKVDVPEDLSLPIGAVAGLAAFPAEQSAAMSLTKKGFNMSWLWDRKRTAIEQTKGLSVWRGDENYDSIGGCSNAKRFMMSVVNGIDPPLAYIFMDEIEKQMAGAGSDTSGVSTELHGILLSWMQDHRANGTIFIGPPGAAKSVMAKATGNTAGVPTISLDMGAMKSSLVGDSGSNLRNALKVIQSISQRRAYFIATCNSIEALSPELRRRFKSATFFYDLPTEQERRTIWDIYLTKYKVGRPAEIPNDTGWTGAEIETCCSNAYTLRMTLKEAAAFIVPVAKSDAERIKRLRNQADGKFISASYPGVYRVDAEATSGRSIEL